ncbi:hypothetical protein PsYK624_092570 [Phanerochaete sordida]|uniref:BTB domain-containing protein n=1 Tax=Phanerochaete sordida TaxID=48140 RepID=A0A9P3GDW0_9APHY|nr:hypothetical protein PsYK624_092570 [Phanerochaete sordida]
MPSENEGGPFQKKQRTNEVDASNPAARELTRDEIVWFDDGNIVVRAGPGCTGDGPVYGFKCHRSILSSKSYALEAMFGLPSSYCPSLDGVPVVDFPDPWEDVRDFLRMMYGSLRIPVHRRCEPTAKMVGGALRLAVKYDAPEMIKPLREVLERDWPNSYQLWADIEEQSQVLKTVIEEECEEKCTLYDVNAFVPDPASVVRLAQDLRIGTVLRAAWYELSRSHTQGSEPYDDDHTLCWAEWNERRSTDVSVLDIDDMKRLLVGRERIRDMTAEALRELANDELFLDVAVYDDPDNPPSEFHPACNERARACLKRLTSGETFLEGAGDPMGLLLRLHRELRGSDTVCKDCSSHLTWYIRHLCERIWDKLEDVFELQRLDIDLDDTGP